MGHGAAPCLTADPRRARSPTIGAAVALVPVHLGEIVLVLVQGPNDVRRAEADLLAAAAAAAAAAEVAMIGVTVGATVVVVAATIAIGGTIGAMTMTVTGIIGA